jgi:uncharacterized repeat protein (TIGR01451 family)
MNRIVRLLLLCWLALVCTRAVPAEAASPYGWVRTSDGRPVAWNNSQPISYSVDQGPLGNLSNADATTLVQTAFQRWAGVDIASISFTPAAPLAQDITGANVLAFLNNLPAGVNPIIFDSDGSVTKMLLGDPGAAVAFGRPLTVDATGTTITSGFVVLNGLYIDGRFNPDDLSVDDYRGMVVQEIGRFLGLGYSQLNTDLILDGIASNNPLVPQMYPVPVPGNADQPTTDDRAALAALYPNPASTGTAVIRGQVLLPDGATGLQGINVIARRVGDPSVTAVSAISGMRFKNEIGPPGLDGSRQPALRGAYALTGLPPGNYTLTLESLRPESIAGPLRHPAFLPGGTQYYRAGGAATTDPNSAGTITISAGQVVENVNIVVAAPAGPPVQDINEQEPNEFPEQAQTLPPTVRVHGSVQPSDASGVSVPLSGGATAAVQDLYRLTITQPTIVTATLSAATQGANLSLFLLTGPVATAPQVVAASTDPGTPPQTFQLRLAAGTYFLGVSLGSGPGSAYTLEVNSTPAPDPSTPAPPTPRLNNLVIGNITTSSADTDFGSDLPSNTLFYVSNPLTEFSNPTVATDHRQSFTGLNPAAPYRVRAMAVTSALAVGSLPDAFFTTASPALPGGVGQISAGIVDTIDDPSDPNAEFIVVGFRNVGTGDASSVTINTLTAPSGWAFSTPLTPPVNLGIIGRGGSGLLMVRVQRTAGTASVGRAYIASHASPVISGSGTYFSPGVGQQTFTFGGLMPSLILSKSASPSTARPGDVVTFTLTVTNQGMGPSTGVLVSDALPAGMTFVPSNGGGQFQNGAVFWNLGTLQPNTSQTVTFQAMVNAGTASGTTITNVALLRTNENPNPIASNVVPVSVSAPPPPPPPQLLLSKSADISTARPGQTITYTLSYTNAGPSNASNVLLTDPLPPGTTLAGAPGGVLSTSGGSPAIIWAIGSLAAGTGGSRTLQLTVTPNTPGGTSITNTAQIMATEAPTPITATAAPVQVTAQPQLLIVKSADRSQVRPGDLITYTITVSNPGSGPATNVQVSDPIPAGTSFSGFADLFSSSGSVQGGTVVWTLPTLGVNANATFSFRVQTQAAVGSPLPITNVAQVASAEIQTPVQSNSVSISLIVPPPPPQLQLTKSADRSTAQPGQAIRYSLTVNNVGAGPATNVQISDSIPAGTNYVQGSADNNGGPIDPNTVGWTISGLQSGGSATVSFQVQVAATSGTVNNVAQVTSAEAPTPVPSNQGNPVVVTIVSQPQLQIQKSVIGAATAMPGNLVTYQLTYSNAPGGGAATNVTIQDVLPQNTTFVSPSSGGFISGVTAIWNIGMLQPGQSGSVTLQVRVNPGVQNGTPITNTAQITSAEIQSPVTSNAVTIIVVAPPPPPQFSLSKQQDVSSVQPGGTVNYQLTVTNSGGTATNVTITDPIPAGMTPIAALDGGVITPAGFGSPAVATWSLGTLGSGASRLVRLQVQVNGNAGGSITNIAQVMSAEAPVPVNSNPASVTVNAPPPPPNFSLQEALSPPKPTAPPGDTLTYVISFQNNGPVTVSGAVITAPIPANTQFAGASQGAVLNSGVLSWNLAPVGPGQGGSVSFQVQINTNTPDQTHITHQSQLAVPAQQYVQTSNILTTIVVVPPPNLSIQKVLSPAKPTAAPGDTLNYVISFRNNGSVTVSGAAVVDPIPANTQLTSASQGAVLNNGVLTWNLGPIGSNQTGSVSFQVQINPSTPDQTQITNTAQITVAAQQYSQNSAPVTTTVVVPPTLTLSKSVNPMSAMPGDMLTYTLTYANTGASAANSTVILDQLPPGVTFGTAANSGQLVSATPPNTGLFVRFNLGTVPAGTGGSVQFTVKVNNGVVPGTQITNQATITASGLAQPVASNSATTTVTAPPPNLSIQKVLSPPKPTAAPGDTLQYVISVRNNGQATVSGAAITDTVPANTQLVAITQGGIAANGVVTWNLAPLAPNQGGQVVMQVKVLPGTPDQTVITNQAHVVVPSLQYSQDSDPVSTTVVVPPPPPLNLAVQKIVDKSTAMPGATLTYTISYKNNGTGSVSGAAIVDPIPANTQVTAASQGFSSANNTLTWNLPTLNPGQAGQVVMQVKILPGTPDQTVITNTAQITVAAQQYSQSSTATTTVSAPPTGLALSKGVDKSTAASGDTLTYTLTYSNSGSQVIHQVAISDPLPAGVTFAGSPDGGQVNGGAVQFTIGDLAAGTSAHVSFMVTVNAGLPNGTVITNQGSITGQGFAQPIKSNSVSTTIGTPPTSFAGTWVAAPANDNAVSLTVDPTNHFTVWAVSKDHQTIQRAAQGKLNPDGSFDLFSSDAVVHFTGKIAANHLSATITAMRVNGPSFTVTAPRAPDVGPLPNNLVGTFNGFATGPGGERFQVRLSIDPGGNSTFEGEVVQLSLSPIRFQFAHFYVTADGILTNPANNAQLGVLQVQNNALVLTYNFQHAGPPPYQNTFHVQLQPLTP